MKEENEKLLRALKICFDSLCTYGSHPIIENIVRPLLNSDKAVQECDATKSNQGTEPLANNSNIIDERPVKDDWKQKFRDKFWSQEKTTDKIIDWIEEHKNIIK